ncbi:MAG TPA: NAD(P)H-binding protein [Mycobacteriales bacterium]|nr:NAD(P)H-binding protein [Mycobacteriales bacterium]
MRIIVAGASGFVGRRLTPALSEAGHAVRAMTRRPGTYSGSGEPVYGDVDDPASLPAAMHGCTAAFYLVHALDRADFEDRDAAAARAFSRAAADAGLQRIVYLGGLGDSDDELSPHLRSRRAVERLLGGDGVPVTTVRAGIIVGHGGISWEITRQLVENLPVMITPRWVHTRTQPVAIADVIRYLVGVVDSAEAADRVFEIGGPEVLEYLEMIRRVARLQGRRTIVLPVPWLSPSLSSWWLALVTDVDVPTGRSLVDSMTNEVVVHETSIRTVVPFEPTDYDTAVLQALGERAKADRA